MSVTMNPHASTGPHIRLNWEQLTRPFGLVLLFLMAALIGVAAAKQNLVILSGLLVLPLLYLAPIQMSLGVFALTVPFDSILVIQEGRSVQSALGAVAGIILLTYGLATGRLRKPPATALWWGAFLLWGATTLLWAIDPELGLNRLPTAIALFLLYAVAVCIRMDREEVRAIATLAALGGFIAAAYAIVGFAQGVGWSAGGLRASLVLGDRDANPNDFASTLMLPFSLALAGLLASQTLLKRVASVLAVGAIAIAIFLAMSRGSLLALGTILVIYLRRLGVRKRVIVPIALIAALPLFGFVPDALMSRLSEGLQSRGGGRFDIWLVGFQAIKHYGFFGAGFDNFPAAYDRFIGAAQVFRGLSMAAHNIYLQIWTEFGIVGIGLLVAAIWTQTRAIARVRLSSLRPDYLLVGVEAAFWGLLVNSLSGNYLWRKHFWMTWAMAALVVSSRWSGEPEEITEPEHTGGARHSMAALTGLDTALASSGRATPQNRFHDVFGQDPRS